MSKQLRLDNETFNSSARMHIGDLGKIKSRTSSYSELATLGKDVASGPILMREKKKIPLDDKIDGAFNEYLVLEQELHQQWKKAVDKKTQEIEFVTLIRKHRPDWNQNKVMDFFSNLVFDEKMGYVNDEGKLVGKDEDGWLVWR